MKALTLIQPWATLVALGAKRIETRSWATRYTGPLAIHAATDIPKWVGDWFLQNGYARAALSLCGIHQISDLKKLPRGAVIAHCELVNVVNVVVIRPSEVEMAFGDYSPGRFAWLLEHVRIVEPFKCRGAQRLWEFEGNSRIALHSIGNDTYQE